MDEELLGGGFSTVVVRRGDTVRRTAAPWSATVQTYLAHLRRVGVDRVPAPGGFDEQGREVLAFVDGTVPWWPWPQVLRSDDGLRQVAGLLLELRAAAATFEEPTDAVWHAGPRRDPAHVVAHGDLGPWNTVWRDDRLVASSTGTPRSRPRRVGRGPGRLVLRPAAPGDRLPRRGTLLLARRRRAPVLPVVRRGRGRPRGAARPRRAGAGRRPPPRPRLGRRGPRALRDVPRPRRPRHPRRGRRLARRVPRPPGSGSLTHRARPRSPQRRRGLPGRGRRARVRTPAAPGPRRRRSAPRRAPGA